MGKTKVSKEIDQTAKDVQNLLSLMDQEIVARLKNGTGDTAVVVNDLHTLRQGGGGWQAAGAIFYKDGIPVAKVKEDLSIVPIDKK